MQASPDRLRRGLLPPSIRRGAVSSVLNVLRALVLGLLAWLAARVLAGLFAPRATDRPPRDGGTSRGAREPERLVRDPVCRVRIPEGRAIVARVGGRDVHFCSDACRDSFLAGSAGEP